MEKAAIFTKSIIPDNIRDYEDRQAYAYVLVQICCKAVDTEEYELAASAYQKTYELAPYLEEVKNLVRGFKMLLPDEMDLKEIEERIRKNK